MMLWWCLLLHKLTNSWRAIDGHEQSEKEKKDEKKKKEEEKKKKKKDQDQDEAKPLEEQENLHGEDEDEPLVNEVCVADLCNPIDQTTLTEWTNKNVNMKMQENEDNFEDKHNANPMEFPEDLNLDVSLCVVLRSLAC